MSEVIFKGGRLLTVTIKDVAKLANVNPSTVSRVISNNPRISEKTKREVRMAMETLGYHPNLNARSLVNKSTQAIGLIMPGAAEKAFQNPFFSEVLRGISTKAHQEEYSLYLSTGGTESDIFDGVVNMVQGRRVDGIILLYSSTNDRIIQYLRERNFPFTVIGKPANDREFITYIDNDNVLAAKEATEYLIKLGHDRVAFVGGSLELLVTVDRLEGYKAALKNSNIHLRPEYIVHEEFLKEGGQEAVIELFSLDDPPTALMVTDDLMAFGVLGSFDEQGIRVPEDVSVVGFNNLMLSEFSRPPLTSVDINIFQLGYNALELLINLVTKPEVEPSKLIVPHKLIVRDSSKEKD